MIAIIMIVYQYALIFCDIIHVIVLGNWLMLVELYRLLFPAEKKSIAGQIALITGTGHGIGKELAVQMSRLGAKVVCCDINEEWNKKTVEDIKAEAGVAWAYRCDVSNRDNVKEVMQMVRSEVGDVDILVNNAGIMPCKPLLKHTPQEITKLFDINIMAHFWSIREWLPVFMSRGSGHIVAMSSLAGLVGSNNLVPYSATKYAVRGLMEGLKEELRYAGRYPGIKLTSVHPFVIDTGLAHKPRIRFPSFNPITPPARAAEMIIDAMRSDTFMICIPRRDLLFYKLGSLLPLSVQHAMIDFLEAEVDEHDE